MAGGYLNVPTDSERNFQQRSVDSQGRAGPTLQRIADKHKVHKNNTGMLESLFEAVAPVGMYSGDAEGAYLPSKTMQNAQGLAKVFQDWYKGGTPTINVPFDVWPDILKSGKFKNQMEVAGKNVPEAWDERMRVEKQLGGYPYPRSPIKEDRTEAQKQYLKFLKTNTDMSPDHKLELLIGVLNDLRGNKNFIFKNENSESLAKKNPVYGHIYNPKYTDKYTATGFGDTHAEMTDLIKDQSKYVIGDSFHPFIEKAFSSDDMLGNTSRLERALFNSKRPEWAHDEIKNNPAKFSRYMEMWVPNHLARLNNVRGVHVPKKAIYDSVDRAVPIRELPNLVKQKQQNYKDIEDGIPEHLKGSIGPEDMEGWDDVWPPVDDEIPF
jgi:hypothetical protein